MDRIKWIDVSKGLAILLVIIGHSIKTDSLLEQIIFSFHMPFFFIIAGYLFNTSREFDNFIYKKAERLLLPYYYTLIIVFIYWLFIGRYIIHDISRPFTILKIMAQTFLLGTGKEIENFNIAPVGTLWFILCLFVSEIIFYSIMKLIKKLSIISQWIIMITICLIGFITSKFIFLPWSIDVSFFSQVFLFTGYQLKMKDVFNKKFSLNMIIFLLFVWCIGFLTYPISMNERQYFNVVSPVLTAIAGSVLFIKLSIQISKFKYINNIFEYLGKVSIIILIYHTMDVSYFHFNMILSMQFLFENSLVLCLFRLGFSILIVEIFRLIPILNEGYGLSNTLFKSFKKKGLKA